jgi:hypothetical protein
MNELIVITPYSDVKWRPLPAVYGDTTGWEVGKSYKRGQRWFLRDPEGYVRTLEPTWPLSKPRVRTVLENYGYDLSGVVRMEETK